MTESAPPSRRRWVALALATLLVATGLTTALPSATAEAASTITMWGTAKPKGVKPVSNSRAVEVGTRFTVNATGKITGVRFYKIAGMKGTHTGTLWSSKGKKLASVTFRNETASGWQTARFSKAVSVKKGQKLTVSLHVPKGGKYAKTAKQPKKTKTSTLKLRSTTTSGVYRYKSSVAYPKTTTKAQYWVDVTFQKKSVASAKGFPSSGTTGVRSGWKPARTISGDYTVSKAGAVVQDLRITGNLNITANNVTIRRVEVIDGQINNRARGCVSNLRIEDTSVLRKVGDIGLPAIQDGGYTAVRVRIDGPSEGFRAGPCGDVVIQDSYANIKPYAGIGDALTVASCQTNSSAWHGDVVQGYGGSNVTVRNSTLIMNNIGLCYGNNVFFYQVNQQNRGRVVIDNVLMKGGGFTFSLGMPGTVSGLKVVADAYRWGPIYRSACSATWGSGNEVVRVNSDGSLSKLASLPCG